jgi:hypothetical protein
MPRRTDILFQINVVPIEENKYQIDFKGGIIKDLEFWSKTLNIPVEEIIERSLAIMHNKLRNKQRELDVDDMLGPLSDHVRVENPDSSLLV